MCLRDESTALSSASGADAILDSFSGLARPPHIDHLVFLTAQFMIVYEEFLKLVEKLLT